MPGKMRPIRIFAVSVHGRRSSKKLITVFQASSLRNALEEYAKRKVIKDPVYVGNTMSGFIGESRFQSKYEAQEAK